MCKFSQPHRKRAVRRPGKLAVVYLPCPKTRAKQGFWLTHQNTNDVFPYVHFLICLVYSLVWVVFVGRAGQCACPRHSASPLCSHYFLCPFGSGLQCLCSNNHYRSNLLSGTQCLMCFILSTNTHHIPRPPNAAPRSLVLLALWVLLFNRLNLHYHVLFIGAAVVVSWRYLVKV